MTVSGDSFRKLAGEARADWHLGCIPSRPDSSFERAIFIAGLAEILRLRLLIVYMPLLQGLQRIENRVDILATLREDPYAPNPALRSSSLASGSKHPGRALRARG